MSDVPIQGPTTNQTRDGESADTRPPISSDSPVRFAARTKGKCHVTAWSGASNGTASHWPRALNRASLGSRDREFVVT